MAKNYPVLNPNVHQEMMKKILGGKYGLIHTPDPEYFTPKIPVTTEPSPLQGQPAYTSEEAFSRFLLMAGYMGVGISLDSDV